MTIRSMLLAVTAASLTACGVSETAAVAAAAGAAKAKEAEQAKAMLDQVQGKLDEAARQAEQRRETAEAR